jgi:tetratricopeptide (TPR) repeat protein
MKPIVTYCFIIIVILISTLGTISRNNTWQNELGFAVHELQTSPTSVRAHNNLAKHLIDEKKPLAAKHYLLEALKLDANDVTTLNNLVVIYSNYPFYDYDQIQFYLHRIIRLVAQNKTLATDNQALYSLSEYLYKNKRYQDSLKMLHRIEKTSRFPDLYWHIGQCNIMIGNNREAKSNLQHALELDPKNQAYNFSYALCIKEENPVQAINILSELLSIETEDKTLLSNIRTLHKELSRHK